MKGNRWVCVYHCHFVDMNRPHTKKVYFSNFHFIYIMPLDRNSFIICLPFCFWCLMAYSFRLWLYLPFFLSIPISIDFCGVWSARLPWTRVRYTARRNEKWSTRKTAVHYSGAAGFKASRRRLFGNGGLRPNEQHVQSSHSSYVYEAYRKWAASQWVEYMQQLLRCER